MLSAAARRSPYVCYACRSRLSHAPPLPRRTDPITAFTSATNTTKTLAHSVFRRQFTHSSVRRLRDDDLTGGIPPDFDAEQPADYDGGVASSIPPLYKRVPEDAQWNPVSPQQAMNTLDETFKDTQYVDPREEKKAKERPRTEAKRLQRLKRLAKLAINPDPNPEEGNDHRMNWSESALRPVLVQTMEKAYPQIKQMTSSQRQLMAALTGGHSVIISHYSGTGKSFAIGVWLLSLERSFRLKGTNNTELTTTALVICPNDNLCLQYEQQMLTLLKATGSRELIENPSNFVQAIYRCEGDEAKHQLEKLTDHPRPHVLIATPAILLDYLAHEDPEVQSIVDFQHIKAIVIEEIDKAVSTYDDRRPVAPKDNPNWEPPKDPLFVLVDYIFRARQAHARIHDKRPTQPQVVIPTAASGRVSLKETLENHHPSWFNGAARPMLSQSPTMVKGPAASVLALGSKTQKDRQFSRKIGENIQPHILSYNPQNDVLSNAPIKTDSDPLIVLQKMNDNEAMTRKLHSKFPIEGGYKYFTPTTADIDPSITPPAARAQLRALRREIVDTGYPPSIAAKIMSKILETQKYPRDSLAYLASGASIPKFIEACAALGIRAKTLTFDSWNNIPTHPPIGGTASLLSRSSVILSDTTGSKEKCTVWVTKYDSVRGLDIPNIPVGVILHRVLKAMEYITYAGRIASWPLNRIEELRDSRGYGRDRRMKGRLFQVVLEDPPEGTSGIFSDGTAVEKWAWETEALRMEKMGLIVHKYTHLTARDLSVNREDDLLVGLLEPDVEVREEENMEEQTAEKNVEEKVREKTKQVKLGGNPLVDRGDWEIEEEGVDRPFVQTPKKAAPLTPAEKQERELKEELRLTESAEADLAREAAFKVRGEAKAAEEAQEEPATEEESSDKPQ